MRETHRQRDKGRIKPSVNPNRSAINCWRLCEPLTQQHTAGQLPQPSRSICSLMRPPSVSHADARFLFSANVQFAHFAPPTLPIFLHGNFRRRTSSLPFHAPPQLDLCTISSALHFSYSSVLLERGWKGGRVVEDKRRRENCREGRLSPPTKQNVE